MAKQKEYNLKAGAYNVSVKFVDDETLYEIYAEETGDEDGKYPLGVCIQIKDGYQLLISEEAKGPLKTMIVWHEIIEMLNSMYDLQFNHSAISTLAEAYAQIIRDNKKTLNSIT